MFNFRFAHEQVASSAEEFASAKNLSYVGRLRFYELVKQELGVRENEEVRCGFERVFQILREEYTSHYRVLFI